MIEVVTSPSFWLGVWLVLACRTAWYIVKRLWALRHEQGTEGEVE